MAFLKRNLMQDFTKVQLLVSFFMLISLLGFTGIMIWNHTINVYKQRLAGITELIEQNIYEHKEVFLRKDTDPQLLNQTLHPYLQKIVHRCPTDFTIGYYSRWHDQVILGLSKDSSVKIDGNKLPVNDPGRHAWETGTPVYTLYYSRIRQNWILKCDYPVFIDGQIVGHSFANITLRGLFIVFLEFILGLFIFYLAISWLTLILVRKVENKVQTNLNRLLLSDIDEKVTYDYVEFESIAKQNSRAHQRVKRILGSITDCFFSLDKDWCFVQANQNALDSIGMKWEDVKDNNAWDIFADEYDVLFQHYNVVMEKREPVHFEAFTSNQWVEVHAYPAENGGVEVYYRDISARKTLEQKAKQLADIVESSEDAIYTTDLTGTILTWNPGAHRLFGYYANEAVGRNFSDLLQPEDHFKLQRISERIARGEELGILEIDFKHKDGRSITVSIRKSYLKDNNGNIIGVASIHRDITEKKQMELDLEMQSEQLTVTLNSIGEGVITIDSNQYITLMNKKAEKLTGWKAREVINQPLSKAFYLINNETSETYENLIPSVLASGEPQHLTHAILVNADLREISIDLSCTSIRTNNGHIKGAVLVFRDITNRIILDRELLKTAKLDSIAVLAGGIAHDFNNYLAAILSNLQLSKALSTKGKDTHVNLDRAIDATIKASDLTKQLLTFAKGGAPVKELASINQLLEETVEFNLHGSKVKAVFSIHDNLWNAEFDPNQLSQVFSNLVINAKQAMPKGGILEVYAENATLKEKPHIKLTFKDHGIGIPKEIIDSIFDPFFTTKHDGTGLGLSTSYSIIKHHGGQIEVSSSIGYGTTLIIYLPAIPSSQVI